LGKVLAYPDSLTAGEIHEARGWPPPDIVCANIQRATGGTLRTPTELYAKVKDALLGHPSAPCTPTSTALAPRRAPIALRALSASSGKIPAPACLTSSWTRRPCPRTRRKLTARGPRRDAARSGPTIRRDSPTRTRGYRPLRPRSRFAPRPHPSWRGSPG
jgi:hypothetical protein